jgi:hypothetical protein
MPTICRRARRREVGGVCRTGISDSARSGGTTSKSASSSAPKMGGLVSPSYIFENFALQLPEK